MLLENMFVCVCVWISFKRIYMYDTNLRYCEIVLFATESIVYNNQLL